MNEVAELELPTQEIVHADLRSLFRGAVKLTLETVLQEVVRDLVGASRWQRLASREDLRDGTYLRKRRSRQPECPPAESHLPTPERERAPSDAGAFRGCAGAARMGGVAGACAAAVSARVACRAG